MLASEPPSTRLHAGGGISVRVNGAAVEESLNLKNSSSTETRSSIVDSLQFGGDSESVAEHTDSGWANATITWRSGAQQYSSGCIADVSSSEAGKTCVVTLPQMVNSAPSLDSKSASTQLVHVIRVHSTSPDLHETTETTVESNMSRMEPLVTTQIVKSSPQTRIRVKTHSNNFYQQVPDNNSNGNTGFGSEKISVVVGPPLNHIMKGEDERSSSGASSAPGSDCERSDSDREGDDGTDSGFSSSRRPCASIMVTTKNTNNVSNKYSSSTCDYSLNGTTKVPVVCNDKGNVKLTIASYADKDTSNSPCDGEERSWDMHFHVHELEKCSANKKVDNEDVQTKISAAHALLSGEGGMYTLKNRVKSSIVSLLVQSASNRNYDQEERGRVVFYTTSMGVVRTTFERCRKVRKILETLMVKFEERDVFMNRGFQQEIRERLGMSRVIVPQVFVEGRHLGGAEVVEQLNEIGHLRELLRPYKRQSVGGTCQQCGGYRYLLCTICGGSKKSVTHRHHFSEDLVALRCVTCDESGLIRCPQCINGEG